jgi:hypothetical protein
VLPPDIHPLPDSVAAYVRSAFRLARPSLTPAQFAYPFTLEPHVVTLESNRRQTLAAHAARREALLAARAEAREHRRREALRRVAPGFDEGGVLVPVRRAAPGGAGGNTGEASLLDADDLHASGPKDAMAELVDGLAALDAK